MSATHKPSEFASTFAQHIQSLHEKIRRKFILSNEHYKQSPNSHQVHREFQKGDQVIVRLRPKQFQPELLRNYMHVVQGH